MAREHGYRFEDCRPYGGGDRGVAPPSERAALSLRRRAAQAEAATAAFAQMQQRIEAIESAPITADERRQQLARLRDSGLSSEEHEILQAARGRAGILV